MARFRPSIQRISGVFAFAGFVLILAFVASQVDPESALSHLSPTLSQKFADSASYLRERVNEVLSLGSDTELAKRGQYQCSKKKPCSNGACCSKSGYCGYGPQYCGKNCVADCNAHAECGQYAKEPGKKCPLNVCCSEFGFCGTTDSFCSAGCQSGCGHPGPPKGASNYSVQHRVIGYYEAWGESRKCGSMSPSKIPINGLTHVNFAFAYIEPETYKITTMDSSTPDYLFKNVADVRHLKSGKDDLEVWISIGGWSFSNRGTKTRPLFGEIAADPDKRKKFARNLVAFMEMYGFQGVDLDWEYPGAPDRGGHPKDTENYVHLVKALREVFDQHKYKHYGISFTAPSSYWYLRWFDLPGMVKHVDWINLMSYDLHGQWDAGSPTGSLLQGHTNLTEIQQSVELFWRVGVPPKKLVLGTGFYGRSFELKHQDCWQPGCPFGGLAKPGPCTDAGGTLGYFEIMDVLKDAREYEEKMKRKGNGGDGGGNHGHGHAGSHHRRQDEGDDDKSNPSKKHPKYRGPIHDKEHAVMYMVYDDNQWISYDNNVTFAQKLKWADEVGLGGVMNWAVDLDDYGYTALESLLGHPFKELQFPNDNGHLYHKDKDVSQGFVGNLPEDQCVVTDCMDTEDCGDFSSGGRPGFVSVGKKICDSGQQNICCPVQAAPKCQWRGGGGLCNGQCHGGEMNLLSIRGSDGDGSTKHCTSGWKIFCCEANSWSDLIDKCHPGDCGSDECPSGMGKIESIFDIDCPDRDLFANGDWRPLCCPKPVKFGGCHWVGQGDCADNTCTNSDGEDDGSIEVWTDPYGSDETLCRWSRSKALCCYPPAEAPYLPVDLDRLFPVVSPDTNKVAFDIQLFTAGDNNVNTEPFGWVIIDGPQQVVSSVNKRDGSHIQFLDCDKVSGDQRQKIRYICTNNDEDSNCDDMHEGGIEGTILRLPDKCGDGTYVVAHATTEADDQSLPPWIRQISGPVPTVMELDFSYDFKKVKRDSGNVEFRIDYSNIPNYWNKVVASKPQTLFKRGFGIIGPSWWRAKFDELEDDRSHESDVNLHFDHRIMSDKSDCSKGKRDGKDDRSAYIDITADGHVMSDLRFGVTIIGSIQPFRSPEAYAFVGANVWSDVKVDVFADGHLSTKADIWKPLQPPAEADSFSHPGIGTIKPFSGINVGLDADIDLLGNFSLEYRSAMHEVKQRYPSTMGKPDGYADLRSTFKPFSGSIDDAHKGLFKVNFMPMAGLDIILNEFDSTRQLLKATISASDYGYAAIAANETDWEVSMGADFAATSLMYAQGSETFHNWVQDDEETRIVGRHPGSKIVAVGAPGDGGDGRRPNRDQSQPIDHDDDAALALLTNALSCSSFTIEFDCSYCLWADGRCESDVPGADVSKPKRTEDELNELEARAPRERRHFSVPNPNGGIDVEYGWLDGTHPPMGRMRRRTQPHVYEAFTYANPGNCDDARMDAVAIPSRNPSGNGQLAVEHEQDRQIFPRFFGDAARGLLPSWRGSGHQQPANTPALPFDFFNTIFHDQNFFANTPPIGRERSSFFPNRLAAVIGSTAYPDNLGVLLQSVNNCKGRIMGLREPRDVDELERLANNQQFDTMLTGVREAAAVFRYINHDDNNPFWIGSVNDFRDFAEDTENVYNVRPNVQQQAHFTEFWDEWIRALFDQARDRVRDWAGRVRARIQPILSQGTQIQQTAWRQLEALLNEIMAAEFDTEGLIEE